MAGAREDAPRWCCCFLHGVARMRLLLLFRGVAGASLGVVDALTGGAGAPRSWAARGDGLRQRAALGSDRRPCCELGGAQGWEAALGGYRWRRSAVSGGAGRRSGPALVQVNFWAEGAGRKEGERGEWLAGRRDVQRASLGWGPSRDFLCMSWAWLTCEARFQLLNRAGLRAFFGMRWAWPK